MKKLSGVFAILLICVFSVNLPFSVSAKASNLTLETDYFENGDYLMTTVTMDASPITRAIGTKSGIKTSTYCNSAGTVLWTFSVKGSFRYTGTTSSCTSVSHTYSVKSSAWKLSSAKSSRSGDKATGSIIAKQYQLGLCLTTISEVISLRCDRDGNLM
jgi:hypothetical protein